MANDLSAFIPQILAQALPILRATLVYPRLVNRQFEPAPGERGSTITIPVSYALSVSDVTPSNTPPSTADIVPTYETITLDRWRESAFYLTDRDLVQVSSGILPMQAQEAVKALANDVNTWIVGELRKSVPYTVGTPGTAPFNTDFSEYLDARRILNENLAPMTDRAVVLDAVADANVLGLRPIQDASYRGTTDGIREAMIGRILGADWYLDQSTITDFTPGTATGWLVNGAVLAGNKQVAVDTGSGTFVPGDTLTFAGDSLPYSVESFAGNILTVSPKLRVNIADNAAVTRTSGSTVTSINFVMHRQAFAFGSRPFVGDASRELGVAFDSIADPNSGLTLRLELSREHKRYRWAFDILYGGKVLRPEWAVKLYGSI